MGALLLASGAVAGFRTALSLLRHRPRALVADRRCASQALHTISAELSPNPAGRQLHAHCQRSGRFEFNQKVDDAERRAVQRSVRLFFHVLEAGPELVDAQGRANFFVNVSGDIQKTFSVDVSELDDEQGVLFGLGCSRMTGFRRLGVGWRAAGKRREMALSKRVGVNTVTAYGADGFWVRLPLAALRFEKNALLVYQVNGQELKSTGRFVPSAVDARRRSPTISFTRNIVDISLTRARR